MNTFKWYYKYIAFLYENVGDDSLKLWDIRNFKKPLVAKDSLLNFFPV